MLVEFESKEIRDERPVKLFQQGYTRKNKDVIVIPPPGSNTSLNGTTMPSNDSSETNLEVHAPSPITSEIATLNLQVGDQSKRYPLRDHKNLIVIFKQSLKILTRVCYGRRNKGYLEELHLGDGRASSRKVDSGM
ncbi:hypothetical protein AAG906_005713 [Vitis piasezkii]